MTFEVFPKQGLVCSYPRFYLGRGVPLERLPVCSASSPGFLSSIFLAKLLNRPLFTEEEAKLATLTTRRESLKFMDAGLR